MIELDPSDPDHNWDNYDSEDLVTANIREYMIEDGDDDRIDLESLKEAEGQLRNRLNDDQNQRRDQHKTAESKKTIKRFAQLTKGGPASEAFKKLGITNSLTGTGKPEDLVGSKMKRVSVDIPEYEPAPNPVPEKLDDLIKAASDQLTEQKEITKTAKQAAADSKKRADDAEISAQRSMYLAIASMLVAILGIATSIYFSATPHGPQTPPQPNSTPTIEQTTK
ncbi:hypothetical protein D3I60_11150 [Brevibacterium permense]|uniref:hypothetical protein n=1 Tax=Brevibacterium permense TaxID=234834 RepID=UPI0021D1C6E4|nr:hypothetical protein [Brevibacterium permense]MCU4297630.1 hypothetical protein [Brevibacterium permense]